MFDGRSARGAMFGLGLNVPKEIVKGGELREKQWGSELRGQFKNQSNASEYDACAAG